MHKDIGDFFPVKRAPIARSVTQTPFGHSSVALGAHLLHLCICAILAIRVPHVKESWWLLEVRILPATQNVLNRGSLCTHHPRESFDQRDHWDHRSLCSQHSLSSLLRSERMFLHHRETKLLIAFLWLKEKQTAFVWGNCRVPFSTQKRVYLHSNHQRKTKH